MWFQFGRGFFTRRYPSSIRRVTTMKTATIKCKFTEFSEKWKYLTDEQREKWQKWITGQTHYKNEHGAFIGLNMIAQSCGMPAPLLNPPPQEQLPPAKPTGLLLTYTGGIITASCEVGNFATTVSAKLRLWLSSYKIHKQIVAVLDIANCSNPTINIDSISRCGNWSSYRLSLADLGSMTIKAQADIVVMISPDTAPLVSEPSEVVKVRIWRHYE